MKRISLKYLIFMAVCCDLGIIAKKLIAPAANLITDNLHIPGGIGTSFSLLFLVTAAFIVKRFGAGMLMGLVQSGIAFLLGNVGSMGALAPLGYLIPGLVIDLCVLLPERTGMSEDVRIVICCALASVASSLTANVIVFGLVGPVLALYCCTACISGIVCGFIAALLCKRLRPVFANDRQNVKKEGPET
ncbi:MAG: hypothetical protein K6A91_04760 [Clostridia bacterium]|nr:hypothetical protein [Clostridia bacterium]